MMRNFKVGRSVRVVLALSLLMITGSLWASVPGHTVATCSPSITTQPASVTVLKGKTATFTLTGTDTDTTDCPTVSIQWQYRASSSVAWTYFTDTTYTSPSPFSGSTVTGSYAASQTDASPATFTISNLPTGVSGYQISAIVTDGQNHSLSSNTVILSAVSSWWLPAGTLTTGGNSPASAPAGYATGALLSSGNVMVIGDVSTTIDVGNATLDTWGAATPALANVLARPTTTLLPTGDVLIAGGLNVSSNTDSSASYLFTEGSAATTPPATTGGTMVTPRESHTASLLGVGQVLVAGGINGGLVLNKSELYDPASQTWTAITALMKQARYRHAATVLEDGTVLVTGGQASSQATSALTSAEIYDPVAKTWTATTGQMNTARAFHTSTLLPNGDVLIAGGVNNLGNTVNSAEIYDPSTKSFTTVTATMFAARNQHAATLTDNDLVLLAGGANSVYLNSSEYFDPTGGSTTINPVTETTAQIVSGGTFTHTSDMTFQPASNAVVAAPVDRQFEWLALNGNVVAAGGNTTSDAPVSAAEKFVDSAEGTPTLPVATVATVTSTLNAATVTATCGPVDPTSLLSTQPGVTFAWTLFNGGSITYPHYPDTSTISFTVTGTAPSSVTLDCLATSDLGIPVQGTATVPIYLAATSVSISNNTSATASTTPTITQGSSILFTANPTGGTPSSYTYQWQYEVNGAWRNWGTSSTQALATAQPYSNDLPIRVTVTNGGGSITSDPVTLYVVSTPVFSSDAAASPTTITSSLNGGTGTNSSTLSATATGNGTITYQWCTGQTPSTVSCTSAGSSLSTLAEAPATGGLYYYYVIATNTIGSVSVSTASSDVTLTVNELPTLAVSNNSDNGGSTTVPTIKVGESILFTGTPSGGYPSTYTYQWQYSPSDGVWRNWGTASTQALTSAQAYSNNLGVRLQVTNSAGTVTSTPQVLYVVAAPVFSSASATPSTITYPYNSSTTSNVPSDLAAAASVPTGDGTISYQWCLGSVASTTCSSPTTNPGSSTLVGPSVPGAYSYYAVATNTENTISNATASSVVGLTVDELPGAVTITNDIPSHSADPNPTIAQGGEVTLTANVASGGYPATYTYQWQYEVNGVWRNWGTSSTQQLSSAQPYSNNLPIRVQVTNTAGTATNSTPETLYVVATPTATVSSTTLNVMSTDSPTLSYTGTAPVQQGTGPNTVSYAWCTTGPVNTAPSTASCPNEFSTSSTASPIFPIAGPFYYYLIVTNTLNGVANKVASSQITITWNTLPTSVGITNSTSASSSSAPTILKGGGITFTPSVVGGYPSTGYTYQWQYEVNGVWRNWGTASSQALTNAQSYSDDLPIRVVVGNTNWPADNPTPAATSSSVTLYVVPDPTSVAVTQSAPVTTPTPPAQPVAEPIAQGTTFSLTATPSPAAPSDDTVTYAWYKGTPPTGTLLANGATGTSSAGTCTSAYSGAATNTLSVTGTCLGDAGSYYAVATNSDNSVSGNPVASNALSIGVNVGTWTVTNNALVAETNTPPIPARYEAMSVMLPGSQSPGGYFYMAGGQNDTTGLLNSDSVFFEYSASSTPGSWISSDLHFVAGPHLDGTATLLPSGSVLIVGGSDGSEGQEGIEYFSNTNDNYVAASETLLVGTTQHVAALLPNQQVLIAGGQNGFGDQFYNTAYLFTPGATPGTLDDLDDSGGTLSVGRAGSKAVTLKDGRILILGGQDAGGIDNAVDIYDSGTSATAYRTPGPTGPYTAVTGASGDYMANANCSYTGQQPTCMISPRLYHTATLLNDGRVLIAGGLDNQGNVLSSVEIWDPAANSGAGGFYGLGTVTAPFGSGGSLSGHAAGTLAHGRLLHSAVLLANGKVLIFGGTDATGAALTSAEVIDPNWYGTTPSPSIPASSTNYPRLLSSSALLPDGTVFTAGGYNPTGAAPLTENTGEIFTAQEGYTTAPAVPSFTPPSVVAGSTSNTASVTVPSSEEITNYSWSAPDETNIVGQGTGSITFTASPTANPSPGYPISVQVTDQYGLSTLLSGHLVTTAAPGHI